MLIINFTTVREKGAPLENIIGKGVSKIKKIT
jgi:hypothetical protein